MKILIFILFLVSCAQVQDTPELARMREIAERELEVYQQKERIRINAERAREIYNQERYFRAFDR